jgi:hypothetical protein
LERDLGARARDRERGTVNRSEYSERGTVNRSEYSERGTVNRGEYSERGPVNRDEYRERGAASTTDYQERPLGDPTYRDRDYCYRERDYRERDRDFGEIVFLEREGEMLAHFQVRVTARLIYFNLGNRQMRYPAKYWIRISIQNTDQKVFGVKNSPKVKLIDLFTKKV